MSMERIDKNVVRFSAVITAGIIALYSVLSMASNASVFILMLVLAGDYVVRVFTPLKLSPIGWLGWQITRRFGMTPVQMDKDPKMFAVRVGAYLRRQFNRLVFRRSSNCNRRRTGTNGFQLAGRRSRHMRGMLLLHLCISALVRREINRGLALPLISDQVYSRVAKPACIATATEYQSVVPLVRRRLAILFK